MSADIKAPSHLNIRPVEMVEITDEAGKTIAVARITERWHGMACITTDGGAIAIIEMPSGFATEFGQIFKRIFEPGSPSTLSCPLVKISPSLLGKLLATANPTAAAPQPGGK